MFDQLSQRKRQYDFPEHGAVCPTHVARKGAYYCGDRTILAMGSLEYFIRHIYLFQSCEVYSGDVCVDECSGQVFVGEC